MIPHEEKTIFLSVEFFFKKIAQFCLMLLKLQYAIYLNFIGAPNVVYSLVSFDVVHGKINFIVATIAFVSCLLLLSLKVQSSP